MGQTQFGRPGQYIVYTLTLLRILMCKALQPVYPNAHIMSHILTLAHMFPEQASKAFCSIGCLLADPKESMKLLPTPGLETQTSLAPTLCDREPEAEAAHEALQPEAHTLAQAAASSLAPQQKPEASALAPQQKPEASALAPQQKPEATALALQQKPQQKPEATALAAQQKPEATALAPQQKPEATALAAQQKPEATALAAQQKPEAAALAPKQKAEATALAPEQKPEATSLDMQQKPEANILAVQQKPQSTSLAPQQKPEADTLAKPEATSHAPQQKPEAKPAATSLAPQQKPEASTLAQAQAEATALAPQQKPEATALALQQNPEASTLAMQSAVVAKSHVVASQGVVQCTASVKAGAQQSATAMATVEPASKVASTPMPHQEDVPMPPVPEHPANFEKDMERELVQQAYENEQQAVARAEAAETKATYLHSLLASLLAQCEQHPNADATSQRIQSMLRRPGTADLAAVEAACQPESAPAPAAPLANPKAAAALPPALVDSAPSNGFNSNAQATTDPNAAAALPPGKADFVPSNGPSSSTAKADPKAAAAPAPGEAICKTEPNTEKPMASKPVEAAARQDMSDTEDDEDLAKTMSKGAKNSYMRYYRSIRAPHCIDWICNLPYAPESNESPKSVPQGSAQCPPEVRQKIFDGNGKSRHLLCLGCQLRRLGL